MERQEVLQQKLENWCAATVRAISNQPSVYFRGHHLVVQDSPFLLQAPYLHLDFSTHRTHQLRGVADSIALRLVYSDLTEHITRVPNQPIEQLVFELLEQLRCEALAPSSLPGIQSNLRNRFLFWAHQAAASSLVENNIGMLLFTINVVCWSRLHSQTIPEQIEDLIEGTRWGFSEELKRHFYEFKKNIGDQSVFAKHALGIAHEVGRMIDQANDANGDDDSQLKDTIRSLANNKQLNMRWLDGDDSSIVLSVAASQVDDLDNESAAYEYKIFNSAYDKVVFTTDVIRAAQLKKLRAQLDKRIRLQSVNTHRVARHLKQLVSNPQRGGWRFDQEEGHLDSARLTKLVTSPNDHRLFRREKNTLASDCVVSIVIDNSGSMTHHNEKVAALIDTLAKSLELADIKTELLGFTTTDWNGGKVLKEWAIAGKPENPGRLNSICHTVYKAAETPWRRARSSIAGLLRSDLFREGIDGEALLWAAERIQIRPEHNKIIIMLSDGSPMDTATHAANSDRYLDKHLAAAAASIERRPDIKLCALGVGLDLTAYYRESMSISLSDELVTKDFFAIAELLSRAV